MVISCHDQFASQVAGQFIGELQAAPLQLAGKTNGSQRDFAQLLFVAM